MFRFSALPTQHFSLDKPLASSSTAVSLSHSRPLLSESRLLTITRSDLTHIMLEERIETLRPPKRQRVEVAPADSPADKDASLVRRHPLGVRPSGNALTSDSNLKASFGLFAKLPDELLAQFLECLTAPSLFRLGGTCRGLHAFTRNEELWRTLFVE